MDTSLQWDTLLQYSKNPRIKTKIFLTQPKEVLTEMVFSGILGYFGS